MSGLANLRALLREATVRPWKRRGYWLGQQWGEESDEFNVIAQGISATDPQWIADAGLIVALVNAAAELLEVADMLPKLIGYCHAHLSDPGHVSEGLLLDALEEASAAHLALDRRLVEGARG